MNGHNRLFTVAKKWNQHTNCHELMVMEKPKMVYPYNGILLVIEKE